ncbi:nitrous oxide reductase family maturation protein NosD [Fibrobacterota bacterium]
MKSICLIILVFFSAGLFGASHTVESGASIQAAIDGAGSGDTVKVAAGTYNESIDIESKTIKLLGGYPGGGDFASRDPEGNVTTIQGSSSTAVVIIHRAADCRVDGFTLTGGNRGVLAPRDWGDAGLTADTISNCIIENCHLVDNSSSEYGAGIKISGEGLVILDNIIRDNESDNRGAGIYTGGTGFLVKGNLFENNMARGDHCSTGCFFGSGTVTENICLDIKLHGGK